jgi:acyl-CoA reductase-like NAD-dependent aldehyde dehydrogenase
MSRPYVLTQTIYLSLVFECEHASTPQASPAELHAALERTREAYVYFRSIPAPRRGEIIRQIREALAAKV